MVLQYFHTVVFMTGRASSMIRGVPLHVFQKFTFWRLAWPGVIQLDGRIKQVPSV